ncbi:hypothetical protein P8452_24865 [Trifolium repens]|nr:hypothetical protein P8452_24864 [Trifolium repens]WJX37053.1 hypothetical protein P8452_24865 [Trifolium repens]
MKHHRSDKIIFRTLEQKFQNPSQWHLATCSLRRAAWRATLAASRHGELLGEQKNNTRPGELSGERRKTHSLGARYGEEPLNGLG